MTKPKLSVAFGCGPQQPMTTDIRVYIPVILHEDGGGTERPGRLEYHFTTEGVIRNLIDVDGNEIGTSAIEYVEIVEDLGGWQ